eukprot:30718-Pelagococcus_subviridis.AAC.4
MPSVMYFSFVLSEFHPRFFGDSSRHAHRGDPSGLRAPDLRVALRETSLPHVLRDLRRLPRAGLADDDDDLVVLHGLDQRLAVRVDGQGRAIRRHGFAFRLRLLRLLFLHDLPRGELRLLDLLPLHHHAVLLDLLLLAAAALLVRALADAAHDLVLDELNLILEDVLVLLPLRRLVLRAKLRGRHPDLMLLPHLLLPERVRVVRVFRVLVPIERDLEPLIPAATVALVVRIRHAIPVLHHRVDVANLRRRERVYLLPVRDVPLLLLRELLALEQVLLDLYHVLQLFELLRLALLQVLLSRHLPKVRKQLVLLVRGEMLPAPRFLHLLLQRERALRPGRELLRLVLVPRAQSLFEFLLFDSILLPSLVRETRRPRLGVLPRGLLFLPSLARGASRADHLERALARSHRGLVLLAVALPVPSRRSSQFLRLRRALLLLPLRLRRRARVLALVVVVVVVEHRVRAVALRGRERVALVALRRGRRLPRAAAIAAASADSREEIARERARGRAARESLRAELVRQRAR